MALFALALTGFLPGLRASTSELQQRVREWLLLKEELVATRTGWQERQDLLQERIRLLHAQKKQLQTAARQSQEDLAQATKTLDQAASRQHAAETELLALASSIRQTETQARRLARQLPPFLRETLAVPDTLAAESASPASPAQLVERLKNVLSVLDRIAQMAGDLHSGRMTIPTPGGKLEMEVFFLGLSQGFAVTPDGTRAAIAHWSGADWIWKEAPKQAGAIRKALAVIHQDRPATFVPLPLEKPPALQRPEPAEVPE